MLIIVRPANTFRTTHAHVCIQYSHNVLIILQLITVNSEAFAVKAKDADGDTILYVLDHMSVSSAI